MKILVIALSGIGDALMFTPALKFLKEQKPDAEIDALVMFRGAEEIYTKMNEISKIHFFDFMNSSKFASLKFVLGLRGKYDTVINIYPSNRREYNLINYLVGAKNRVAVSYNRQNFRSCCN